MDRFKLTLFLFLAPIVAFGAKYELELGDGKTAVSFTAIAKPGNVRINGRTREDRKDAVTGKLMVEGVAVSGEVRYSLDAFDTGFELRNRHMRDKYLETGKWPAATIKLTKLNLPQAFIDGDFVANEEPFTGDLTLREETHPIAGKVTLKREGDRLGMLFVFPVSLKAYKTPPPEFMGIKVADEVEVTVDAKTQIQKK